MKKHIFLSSENCRFVVNFLLNLVNLKLIDKDSILIATHESYNNAKPISDECISQGFDVCDWKEILNYRQIDILSVNSISLHTKNSHILEAMLDSNLVNEEAVNILITDDEVDRWNKIYLENGKLAVSKKYLVDEHLLNLLDLDINFICPRSICNKLAVIINKDIRCLDAHKPFTILDISKTKDFERLHGLNTNKLKHLEKRVLIYTKPSMASRKLLFPIKIMNYFLFKYKKDNKPIIIGLWLGIRSRNLLFLQLAIFLIRRLRKVNISTSFLSVMSPEKYLLTLYEYDTLILQGRGGFSAAKYFGEKIGRIVVEGNTFNHTALEAGYDYSPLVFKKFNESLDLALSEFDSKAQKENSEKIVKRHEQSLERLKKLWITNND